MLLKTSTCNPISSLTQYAPPPHDNVMNIQTICNSTPSIDTLSHSTTLQNKILQELNFHGLCKYSSTQQVFFMKFKNKIVNCSYILVFLKQSTWYIIIPDALQWCRVNVNEVTDNHKTALCSDPTVHMVPSSQTMVPLSQAEPLEVNAVKTIERLTHSHTSKNHPYGNCPQSIYSHTTSTNNNTTNSLQNNAVHPYDQSTVILQQYSMIMHELKKLYRQSVW